MARLSSDKWAELRADYEVHGLSLSELSSKYEVGRSTISEKAKKLGWEKGSTEHLVQKKINAIKELDSFKQETEQLTEHHRTAINDRVSFALKNETRMEKASRKAEKMIDEVENPNGIKALMDTFAKHREAVIGKNPDTAIQINNQSAPPSRIEIVAPNVNDSDTATT